MAHEIRLAGPWELCHSGDVWERCALPYPTAGAELKADCRLRRKFHRPSGISEQTQLAIVVAVTGAVPTAEMNGVAVTALTEADGLVVFDVTKELSEYSTIELMVPVSCTVTEVKLRIVEPR